MRYEIIIRVSPDDPLAKDGQYRVQATTDDPVLAEAIREHYRPLGWVKGVAVVDTVEGEFVHNAIGGIGPDGQDLGEDTIGMTPPKV